MRTGVYWMPAFAGMTEELIAADKNIHAFEILRSAA
jgi:hypothetical protein